MSRRYPWRRKWQSTPVFLPEESHGQKSLAGYSPWGRKESDMAEVTEHMHTHPLLGQDLLDLFPPKRDIVLEPDGGHQGRQQGEVNDPLTFLYLFCL